MTRVLVVDDGPQILRALRINLLARHFEVAVAADGGTAASVPETCPRRPCVRRGDRPYGRRRNRAAGAVRVRAS
ncbi:response regulator [Streptosporangium minutum]|uniref:Response regulatory domain-containing protein n=1 Tax=Streptosporangium minutum TaxID=569862 RepID=A0A243RWP3_9ACTN|nr:hypothetical protein CA984_02485 [Streptosporangium minutum]